MFCFRPLFGRQKQQQQTSRKQSTTSNSSCRSLRLSIFVAEILEDDNSEPLKLLAARQATAAAARGADSFYSFKSLLGNGIARQQWAVVFYGRQSLQWSGFVVKIHSSDYLISIIRQRGSAFCRPPPPSHLPPRLRLRTSSSSSSSQPSVRRQWTMADRHASASPLAQPAPPGALPIVRGGSAACRASALQLGCTPTTATRQAGSNGGPAVMFELLQTDRSLQQQPQQQQQQQQQHRMPAAARSTDPAAVRSAVPGAGFCWPGRAQLGGPATNGVEDPEDAAAKLPRFAKKLAAAQLQQQQQQQQQRPSMTERLLRCVIVFHDVHLTGRRCCSRRCRRASKRQSAALRPGSAGPLNPPAVGTRISRSRSLRRDNRVTSTGGGFSGSSSVPAATLRARSASQLCAPTARSSGRRRRQRVRPTSAASSTLTARRSRSRGRSAGSRRGSSRSRSRSRASYEADGDSDFNDVDDDNDDSDDDDVINCLDDDTCGSAASLSRSSSARNSRRNSASSSGRAAAAASAAAQSLNCLPSQIASLFPRRAACVELCRRRRLHPRSERTAYGRVCSEMQAIGHGPRKAFGFATTTYCPARATEGVQSRRGRPPQSAAAQQPAGKRWIIKPPRQRRASAIRWFMHLTNYSVNKHSASYTNGNPTRLSLTLAGKGGGGSADGRGHKWRACNLCGLTCAVAARVPNEYDQLQPWLLEVNISPSLHKQLTRWTFEFKVPMVTDLMRLAGFQLANWAAGQMTISPTEEERANESIIRAGRPGRIDRWTSSAGPVGLPARILHRLAGDRGGLQYLRYMDQPRYSNLLAALLLTCHGRREESNSYRLYGAEARTLPGGASRSRCGRPNRQAGLQANIWRRREIKRTASRPPVPARACSSSGRKSCGKRPLRTPSSWPTRARSGGRRESQAGVSTASRQKVASVGVVWLSEQRQFEVVELDSEAASCGSQLEAGEAVCGGFQCGYCSSELLANGSTDCLARWIVGRWRRRSSQLPGHGCSALACSA
uniref:Protein kinase domain-containing protein n=1 Tax=Macrostomum lignano TaxID=282301 RepID=A0A1I8FI91_9PLAT